MKLGTLLSLLFVPLSLAEQRHDFLDAFKDAAKSLEQAKQELEAKNEAKNQANNLCYSEERDNFAGPQASLCAALCTIGTHHTRMGTSRVETYSFEPNRMAESWIWGPLSAALLKGSEPKELSVEFKKNVIDLYTQKKARLLEIEKEQPNSKLEEEKFILANDLLYFRSFYKSFDPAFTGANDPSADLNLEQLRFEFTGASDTIENGKTLRSYFITVGNTALSITPSQSEDEIDRIDTKVENSENYDLLCDQSQTAEALSQNVFTQTLEPETILEFPASEESKLFKESLYIDKKAFKESEDPLVREKRKQEKELRMRELEAAQGL